MTAPVLICPNPRCPDLEATGVPGEYVAGTEVCPYCGTRLEDPKSSGAASIEEGWTERQPTGEGMEPVFESEDPAEIAIVRTILDGARIPNVTTHDSASDRVLPGFDPFRFGRGPRAAVFWVPTERAEEARALLTEADPTVEDDGTAD